MTVGFNAFRATSMFTGLTTVGTMNCSDVSSVVPDTSTVMSLSWTAQSVTAIAWYVFSHDATYRPDSYYTVGARVSVRSLAASNPDYWYMDYSVDSGANWLSLIGSRGSDTSFSTYTASVAATTSPAFFRVRFSNVRAGGADANARVHISDVYLVGSWTANSYAPKIADSLGITDSKYQLSSGLTARIISETIGITDSQNFTKIMPMYLSENLGVTDSQYRQATYLKAISDAVGITDSQFLQQDIVRLIADAIGLEDSVLAEILASLTQRNISDSIGVEDSVYRVFNANRNNSESIGISDDVQPYLTIIRQYAEAIGIADELSRFVTKILNISEDVGLTDYQFRQLTSIREIADQVGTEDYLSSILTQVFAYYISESIGVSDSNLAQKIAITYIYLSEEIGITDDTARILSAVRVLSEDIGLSDYEDYYKQIVRVQADTVGILDDPQKYLAYVREITDTLGIEDLAVIAALGEAILHIREIADAVGITDESVLNDVIQTYLAILLSILDSFANSTAIRQNVIIDSKSSSEVDVGVMKHFIDLSLLDNEGGE